METNVSRRGFVTGAAAAALAGAAAIPCGRALGDEWSDRGMPEAWDRETDVVVLGTGSIVPAALKAYDEGLEVLVLEKHPSYFGGTTAWCGGAVSCPNSPFALEAGKPEIPRDVLKEYLENCADGQSSDELIEMMLDNYVPAIEYLSQEAGYDIKYYNPSETPGYCVYRPCGRIEEEYAGVCCTVGMNAHESGAVLGRAFQAFGRDAVEEREIEVLFGTAGKKLIYNGNPLLGDGEVVGVWAEGPEGPLAIKARYGVIVGTGGFDFNREMVQHYLPAPIYSTCSIETNTGDGHIMAMEVGAAMANMNECYRVSFTMPDGADIYQASYPELDNGSYASEEIHGRVFTAPGKAGSIMVNKLGQRFGNESSSYDMFGRNFEKYDTGRFDWTNIPGYLICDGTYVGNFGSGTPTLAQLLGTAELTEDDKVRYGIPDSGDNAGVPPYVHRFETIEELADGMGIDKENLLATVERFNGFCEEGVDRDWNRGAGSWDRYTCGNQERVDSGELKNPCLAPIAQPPFFCVEIYPGMLQTKGGIVINGNAQVLNVRGEVIPRLYAGSCTIANPLGRGYGWAGGTVANGFVVGYVAGSHVATLEPWEE